MNRTFIPSLLAVSAISVVSAASVATAQIRATEASVTALAVQCAVSSGYSTASYYDYESYARSLAKTLGMLSSGQQVKVFGYLPAPSGGGFVDADKPQTSTPAGFPPEGSDPISSPMVSQDPSTPDSASSGGGFMAGLLGGMSEPPSVPAPIIAGTMPGTPSTAEASTGGEVSVADQTVSEIANSGSDGSKSNASSKSVENYDTPDEALAAGLSEQDVEKSFTRRGWHYRSGKWGRTSAR